MPRSFILRISSAKSSLTGIPELRLSNLSLSMFESNGFTKSFLRTSTKSVTYFSDFKI